MAKEVKLDNNVSNNEGGILSRLWRNVLIDNNLVTSIPFLVTRYVTKTATMDVKNVKRKTKSSLIDNINAQEMTWKTFTNLIFNFLGVKRMDLTIKLTLPNGNETYHTVTINNSKGVQTNTNNIIKQSGKDKLIKFFTDNNINYKEQYKLENSELVYMFYLPNLNILVDYYNKDVVDDNKSKVELAKIKHIPYITLTYKDSDKIEDYLLWKISKIFKYRVKDKWYKTFKDLCVGENLSGDTTHEDVKQYLVFQKES